MNATNSMTFKQGRLLRCHLLSLPVKGRARCPNAPRGWTAVAVGRRRGEDTTPCQSPVSWLLTPVFCLLFSAFCLSASAQYSINWYKVAGGGGTSTGGGYTLNGTIGQPDAGGPMTNGQYSVSGGFWVLPVAVQVSGAPTLSIVPGAPGQAVISWEPNTSGYVLQETWSLATPNWTNSLSGTANPTAVPATQPLKFYRLIFRP